MHVRMNHSFAAKNQVTLWGNAPWMGKLAESLTATRRAQLVRVRSFLKLENSKRYVDSRGRPRCVSASVSESLNKICDANMSLNGW